MMITSPAIAQLMDDDITALQERGAKEGWTFTVGKNPATQYPIENLAGAREPEGWRESVPVDPCTPKRSLPEAYDWREFNGCASIKNQGSCGSCWAFSSVGSIECAIKIHDEVEANLSEQWLVSCNTDGSSCDGGWYMFDYFIDRNDACGEIGGVMEVDFHYAAADLPCGCPYPREYYLESWAFIGDPWDGPDINAMKQAILDYGPISVGCYAGDAMQGYNGGIFNVDEGDWTNHLVVLVGWDDNQGDSGVWIMRNSWGGGWGEDGYMWIEYGVSLIGDAACYVDYKGIQRVGLGESDFSDDLGDSDGIFESGETIELIAAVTNLGPEQVTDVSVELSFDDPTLTIVDGSTYLGNIPSGDSVSNTGDPFQFIIPAEYVPRINLFILEVTWNCGIGCDTVAIDTMIIEMAIGSISILLVDDDEGDDIEQYYGGPFWKLRVPWHTWTVAEQSEPMTEDLNLYDVVVWFVGDYRSDPLNSSEVIAMQDYLDSGGNLFLSGQGIAAQLGISGDMLCNLTPNNMEAVFGTSPQLSHSNLMPPFLQDYLYAEYVSTGFVPILSTASGSQVFDAGDSVAIYGAAGAGNQSDPDVITPISGGIGEMKYLGVADYGAVSYAGSYKSVFFAFGYEAILGESNRWTERGAIMIDILDFFNYQMPAGSKLSPDLHSANPPAGVHSYESMEQSDANDRGVITYSYEVYNDAGLTSLVTQAENQPEGSGGVSSWTVPVPLTEDEDYHWRVRANDDGVPGQWSDVAAFWINAVNQNPVSFNLISPVNGATVSDLWPTFVWSSTTDPDGYDDITYRLYHSTDPAFATCDSIIDVTDTSYTPDNPIDLDDASICYWKVMALDLFGGERGCNNVFAFTSLLLGDANGDGMINVADPVFLINYIFKMGPAPDPLGAGDANCDQNINVGDPVYLIAYIFMGGPEPGCF